MRELIKKVLWPLLPKPWETADMEFHYGLWNGVSALYSESGRQLGEENARPLALNHHIPAETIACKYQGSRAGRAINMSALRIAMQNFDDALSLTGAVRSYHLEQLEDDGVAGIWDLYIIARASIALIAYQKRFRHQTDQAPKVSDVLASQYQFISGVFMICRHMMENAHPAINRNEPQTAEALFSYADENGIFISFNNMACAGSTKKIMDFLKFCNHGDGQTKDQLITLTQFVTEPDNWYQYALATIELDCMIEAERMSGQMIEKSAQIYADVGDYTRSLMGEPSDQTNDVFLEDRVLLRQNHILNLLRRGPIKNIPSKHWEARLSPASVRETD